jgi:excinuclease ABC subunit A
LLEGGASVLIIEHNLDVIKSADWMIDMGPEGGDAGGKVVGAGTPEQLARNSQSHTGKYLVKALANGGNGANGHHHSQSGNGGNGGGNGVKTASGAAPAADLDTDASATKA